MRKILRWFKRHFGGRMQYMEATGQTLDGSIWVGTTENHVVVGYKGNLFLFSLGLAVHFGGFKRMLSYIIYIMTAPENLLKEREIQHKHRLKVTSVKDFEMLQRTDGACLFLMYMPSSQINKLNQQLEEIV